MKPKLTERSDVSLLAEFDPTPSMFFIYIFLSNKNDDTLYCSYSGN